MSKPIVLLLRSAAVVGRFCAGQSVLAVLAAGAVSALTVGGTFLAQSAHAVSVGGNVLSGTSWPLAFGSPAHTSAAFKTDVSSGSVAPTTKSQAIRNGRIVFQRYVGKVQQLFTIKPDGTGLRQLTHSTKTSENADWSADASKIVFDRTPVSTGNALGSLYVINANGSGETPLAPNSSASGYFYETPAWSPNGRQVAFRRYRISPYVDGIWIMHKDGSHLRQLTQGPGLAKAGPNDCACDADPRFSPDGRRIVFDREPSAKQAAVFVVNVDGTGLRRLTPWRLDAGEPRWSPDNSLILYSTYLDPHPGKSSNLYTMRPSGTGVRALTHNSGGNGNSSNPAWSPNGKLIVFTHNQVALASHSRNDLYVMPTQGGPARQLTHLARFDANKADWGAAR